MCEHALVGLKFQVVREGEVEDEIRRIRLKDPSFAKVRESAERWTQGPYTVLYTDDEGDLVSLESQEEWEECRSLLRGKDPLKLRIEVGSGPFPIPAPILTPASRGAGSPNLPRAASRSPVFVKRRPSLPAQEPSPEDTPRTHTPTPPCSPTTDRAPPVRIVHATQVDLLKVLEKLYGNTVAEDLATGVTDATKLGSPWLEVTEEGGEVVLGFKADGLARRLHGMGIRALESGEAAEAEDWFRFHTQVQPEAPHGWYNLACGILAAGDGRENDACDALEKAFEAGYRQVEHIRQDGDLEGLQGHPRFESLLEAMAL